MSKLKRRRKNPSTYDEKNTLRIAETSPDVNSTPTMLKDKRIFQRGIINAQKHGINLEPGRENQGNGNCSYEAVIYNINDRSCFNEKLPMSPDYYRRIWNIDMMNKIIYKTNKDWNPGLTEAQLREGFAELMESGVYERPFFGDMMMAGIACGIKKRILIFNTNERTPHDPISVIDPVEYGGSTNSEIPIVVAYDLVHYESLHTMESKDIEETIKLVESYIAKPCRYGVEYGFAREDMNYLIGLDVTRIHKDNVSKASGRKTGPKTEDIKTNDSKNEKVRSHMTFIFGDILFEEVNNGKIRCGVCLTEWSRLVAHLNSSKKCSQRFNMAEFRIEYSKYRSRLRAKTRDMKRKQEDLDGFKEKAREKITKHRDKKKAENLEKFKAHENQKEKERQAKRKAEDSDGFRENAKKSKQKYEDKMRNKDLKGFQENMRQRKIKSENNRSADKRIERFKSRVRYGPIFVCSCCHQKLFDYQVDEYTEMLKKEIDLIDGKIIEECIEEVMVDLGRDGDEDIKRLFICKSCRRYLKAGKFPKLCSKNGLEVDDIPDPKLKLTELENNLIARNIVFQKIHKMPKSRWNGTHDRLVNVPVGPQDVLNTIESLPRTPGEAGIIPIIPVNLKRKLEYKTSHLKQMIDTSKIYKYLQFLCESGHPSYKFYDDWNIYKNRCQVEDPIGAKIIFPEEEAEIVDLKSYLAMLNVSAREEHSKIVNEQQNTDLEDKEKEEDEAKKEEEYKTKDVIRKFQYDYNKTTCLTHKFPEADSESALNFAPAEGKIPTSILKDEDWDINSFPNLHPSGKNKMFQERKVAITTQQYLTQRMKNKDERFQQCTPYVFAVAGYLEEKQMERNIGLSFSKGKISESSGGSRMYKLEDAYSVLDDVRGTPRYWKKAKMEMLSKIDNFGPFHWFYTLSCADMRWEENFSTILKEKGYKIIWRKENNVDDTDNNEVHVEVEVVKDGKIEKVPLKCFLEEECDESMHESIRTNVFIATRNFMNRVKAFRTEIMMGKNNPLRITYWSDKMEFQGRGAGHIHGVAWSDLQAISKLIEEERKFNIILSDSKNSMYEDEKEKSQLENAYKSLRENERLKEAEEEALIDFVDRSVTCTLCPDLAAKMINLNKEKDFGIRIIEIVKACMIHYHTQACQKCGGEVSCRFRFPKFPMWETILTSGYVHDEDEKKKKERLDKHKKVLNSVSEVLEDEKKLQSIMDDYDKENENIFQYKANRKKRIMIVLELARVNPDDYVLALKESTRKGINVILARDIDELNVNNYNPECLLAWNGNIDWSPVFDFFAVTTYVTEYFTKDESGTSKFLAEASKQINLLPIKDKKRCIKNVFLTHRQMGLFEAFVKILPEMKLKDSNLSTIFVPLGKKEEISRYLLRADPELDYFDKELFEVNDRDGLYYEKPNWVDKYLRRDLSEWNELCMPQYIKMFDPSNKRESEEEDREEDFEADEDDVNNNNMSRIEKDKVKYKSEFKFHYLITRTGVLGKPLPKFMKLGNAYPGEPKYLRKRKHPKALRFYKVKRNLNPDRFFLHELMMYRSFDRNDYERWHDDVQCRTDYERYKEDMQKVKSQIMEWMEDVEEARYFVEETMKNDLDVEETGEEIDPEKEKEDLECDFEGTEEDEAYLHLNPEGLKEKDFQDPANWYRKLEVLDMDLLQDKTVMLDEWQRKVVDIGLKFARGHKKFGNGFDSLPKPENLVVIGGAGSGKSTVIECLAQWAHRVFVKEGDDPCSPYVLKAATTGAASALIEGSTVHSSLGFDHSSKHTSLNDKKRELKREQLKNLRILIIDEFSMMKADILYRIHLRLQEITQKKLDFGGVNVILLGDPAQLKPVRGSYTFSEPNCPDYKLAYGDGTNSLWRRFKVINLEENHRQGGDKVYADLLNRVRLGNHTKDDIKRLKTKVRPKGHEELKGALFISAKVKPVSSFNEKAINRLPGKLFVCKATHIQAMSKSYKPKLDKTGRIGDTHFVDEFKIKIGARVMLIFNVDVSDLLCNGSLGTVIGIEENPNKKVAAVIVHFDNPEAGKEARKRNPMMGAKYPNGTIIKKMERDYSLAKSKGLVSSMAKLIQFPLVLAWAVTAHKFQGQTVKKPQKVAVDVRSVFEAAQAYVMFSRVQELDQLYILEELPEDKIYASIPAQDEIKRLVEVSINRNPSVWDCGDESRMRIGFLNCRSMKNKFKHLKADKSLLKSDVIVLTETWLEPKQMEKDYELENFSKSLSSKGRGKGIAVYFNHQFLHVKNIDADGFTISKLSSKNVDVIGIYKSRDGDSRDLMTQLDNLITENKTTIIGGDFNVCVLRYPNNLITERLQEKKFQQVVKQATHIEGGLLDHVYIKQIEDREYSLEIELSPKYYSDHDCIGVMLTPNN